ncbi:MAG: ABC transporter substrate-binding protein [Propionibacteriaceae bacterium]|jgi:ABC-type transport system substrate-binding protein|nr:ABC transporter substrate-binding protein [Propionibacteriaceae bacterium]
MAFRKAAISLLALGLAIGLSGCANKAPDTTTTNTSATVGGATGNYPDAQKRAIRQAIASSVDRDALATQVYKGQYTPLCSYVPDGYVGANKAVCDTYGSTPDKAKATAYLSDAGIATPVTLNIQYNPDHYGSSSDQEYGLIKQQLESTGLFTVNLQSTEWVTYNKERVADAYPIYQLGWFPDFPDADNYLTPFFASNNFVGNHFDVAEVNTAIGAEVTETDPAKRAQEIGDIQTLLAEKYLSTLPLLQGSQWAVSGTDVTGINLGVDENLHFNTIAKGSDKVTIGTTDKLTTLDPAGAYDHGSLGMAIQVFPFVVGFVPGENTPQPDIATSCGFTEPTVFQCKLKSGLKFANGHDLTSSDVKFSFDRVVAINDPNGPASLLGNLDSVEAPDPTTVNFKLKAANDQTFEQVLATSAGPIVDEEVFPANSVMSDEDIVAANAFAGPYTITSYSKNDTVELAPYAGYGGAGAKPANAGIIQKTFTDATNLKLSITNGDIDVAYRSLTPTDIEALQKDSSVKVWDAKGGEIRYIVFNLNTMPGA